MEIRIASYQDQHGQAGKLKGIITFTDGRLCNVWDEELHAQCKDLAREVVTPVRYHAFKSPKWGWTLKQIDRTKDFATAYDEARAADEARGRVKPNSYLGQKIAKKVSAA